MKTELQKARRRLAYVNSHYERLIEYNARYNYVFSENPKLETLLLKLRKEKKELWVKIRELNPVFNQNIKNGVNALVSLTRQDLRLLTDPNL